MIKRIVKIFLLNRERKVLLYLRDNNPDIVYQGCWDLIGGGVENGESDLSALEREIKEEIGCRAMNIKEIGFIEDNYKKTGQVYHIKVYTGEIDTPLERINLTEGQKVNYYNTDDLYKIKICDCYKEFIKNNRIF